MKYMRDTNICIYLIKKKNPRVLSKFNTYAVGEIAISSITVAELQFGIQKSQFSSQNQRALEQFLVPLASVSFDDRATSVYGKIRATLERQGIAIGSLDMLIAAHAISLNATLITNNVKEFSRIEGLKLANWASD